MNYIEEANQTKSDQFHGELVPFNVLLSVLQQSVGLLNQLDQIKKALFYGREINLHEIAVFNANDSTADCAILPGLITKRREDGVDLIHGIIGKATEAGELLEALLKCWSDIEADGIDKVNLMEEIGDGQWYDAIMAKALGFTFEEVQKINIDKLRARFPNRFTEYDAENRDLNAEREILEGVQSETDYLLQGENGKRLLGSIEQHKSGSLANKPSYEELEAKIAELKAENDYQDRLINPDLTGR